MTTSVRQAQDRRNTIRRMNPNDPNTFPNYVFEGTLDAWYHTKPDEYIALHDLFEGEGTLMLQAVRARRPKAFANYRNRATDK